MNGVVAWATAMFPDQLKCPVMPLAIIPSIGIRKCLQTLSTS
jgi:hypothetical protein